MLRWTLLFLVVAVIAALFGYSGIAGEAAGIAQVLFFISLILFLVSLTFGWRNEWGDRYAPPPTM